MAINYAAKYSDKVDQRFVLGSLTEGIINREYDWVGVNAVNVFSRDLATLNDYTMQGNSRYGNPTDLGNGVQTMVLTQDKSFTYVIDRRTQLDTMGTMEAAATLAENIDNVLIPTVDAYRLSVLVAKCPTAGSISGATHIKSANVSASNAYSEFLACQEMLDNDKAPSGGRVCICSPGFYNYLKLDNNFVKQSDLSQRIALNGQVGEVDGVAIVKVPASYLPANVDFIITNAAVMPSPMKIYELKIHDDAPGISGSLVEARFYYDAFALDKKVDAIAVHTNSSGIDKLVVAPTTLSVAVGATGQLKATTVPNGGTVTWASSDSTVATVDANTGVVTGVASGTATITATFGAVTETATVTVS